MLESSQPATASPERMAIASLRELDALVGERLTRETPRKHWENARTRVRFGSLEEALEALHDPFFRELEPETEETKPALLTEVKEFARYSSDLNVTWRAVEYASAHCSAPLVVRRDEESWSAAFGEKSARARIAAVAICLAALRAIGLEVECEPDALA